MPKLTAIQQAERRQRLLDAAERCFARSGFHAATMAEIARAARVSAGAAYIYFDSKEDLIAGIAERDRQRIGADFAAIGDAPDFAAALEGCARFYLIEQPDHKRKLLVEMSAESTRNPVVARNFRSVDRVVQDAFRRALERHLAAGRIKPAQSLECVVQLLMVLGDGMLQRRATDPDFDAERMLASIMAMVRQMLGVDQIRTSKKEGRIARRVA